MWGWLPGRVLSGSLNGSGPAGGSALAEGPGGRLCLVGLFSRVVGLSGDWCRKHARCCLLGGGGCPRVPLVCGGGMLSGFWSSAPDLIPP